MELAGDLLYSTILKSYFKIRIIFKFKKEFVTSSSVLICNIIGRKNCEKGDVLILTWDD